MEENISYLDELKNSLDDTQGLIKCLEYRSTLFEWINSYVLEKGIPGIVKYFHSGGITGGVTGGMPNLNSHITITPQKSYIEYENYCKEWEFNEKKILYLKGKSEINALSRVYKEKLQYFEKFSIQFEQRKIEMEQNYERILNLAKKLELTNPIIKQHLENTNWEMVMSSIEVKVNFYERLKKLTENNN